MPKLRNELSLSELQSLVAERKTELDRLKRERSQLEHRLSQIEKRITAMGGSGFKSRGRRRRPKNEKSLRATIRELLGRSKKGYTLSELADKVLASGYKTYSSDFQNVLYQCLYNAKEFFHDPETATYRMKG